MNPTENGRRSAWVLFIWFLGVTVGFSMAALGCQKEKNPIKLGFVGCLTGRLSDLGTSGRNGALLAVEEANKAGGIDGRPIELIIKDDQQDQETALKVDKALIEAGVAAIIGHMTSAMSVAAVPLMNKEGVLMVSPTTSTDALKGIKDHFIRTIPPNSAGAERLARHAVKAMGIRQISVVYVLANSAYTEGFVQHFKTAFEHFGGKALSTRSFESGKEMGFSELAKSIIRENPDAVLLVAGALDSAMICQYIRMHGSKMPIFSAGWAMTHEFLEHGGPAVEGVFFSQLFDAESRKKSYRVFKDAFESRFGKSPDFAACHGYEAARLVIDALRKNSDPDTLRSTVLEMDQCYGVQGDFTLDPYGDPHRKRPLIRVRDGKFRKEKSTEMNGKERNTS